MTYHELIRKLPLPTKEQYESFIKHVSNVHNWYKHLSIIDGGEFIVMIDPNAGVEYPEMHTRLPFGNTRDGYIKAFGYLSYCWKTKADEIWDFDGRHTTSKHSRECLNDLPEYIMKNCRFTLYPYICGEFEDVFMTCHFEDLQRIKSGLYHPNIELLTKWEKTYLLKEEIWRSLSSEEKDMLSSFDENSDDINTLNEKCKNFIESERAMWNSYTTLYEIEMEKIKKAVFNLRIYIERMI